MEELETLGAFGLRTKKELWKAHTELSRLRKQARALLALRQEERSEKTPILLNSLAHIGLVSKDSTLDDILNLKVTDLLNRRLQTLVVKKLGFKSPYQARQAVVHGHVSIKDRIIDIPSYIVSITEEDSIKFTHGSSLKDAQSKSDPTKLKTAPEYEVEDNDNVSGTKSNPENATE